MCATTTGGVGHPGWWKAGIINPQTMQAIMDTLMAELDRQIAEAAGKEAKA